ncbi:MAG TPA: 50S ribosomal protein L15 [Longimicrobiales bacterium]|nr:50S ribosomal protein L15 [Longimicrobiales bacterium]
MSDLSNLPRPKGANRDRKRLGRGPGSGTGKTSGKGHKGQKARTGHHGIPAWFEGGQMPIQRRVPKRGFTNIFRTEYEIVNLDALQALEETEITPEVLHQYRLVDLGKGRPVKVLANGDIDRKVTVHAHKVSAAARTKIEAAGGSVELLES